MGLTVLPPDFEEDDVQISGYDHNDNQSDSDRSMDDGDGRPSKRPRLSSAASAQIALPGEVITDETQWMR